MTPPNGFSEYWREIDAELASVPSKVSLEPAPAMSTVDFTVSAVRLDSIGPYRIFGYFSVPTGPGPFPGLLDTPRYGSVNLAPHYNDRLRYVILTVMHRGQRQADHPFAAAYPGLLTHGIERPSSYVYRGIAADCLRAAEFLLTRPEIDTGRAAVRGDDLALITAARRPGFATLMLTGQLFYRALAAAHRTSEYPLEELNDYLRMMPGALDAVRRTLALFDPIHHAGLVEAVTLLTVGAAEGVGSAQWLNPLVDALGGPIRPYWLTDEDGTDHDRLDALLAERLGAEPMSKFRRTIG